MIAATTLALALALATRRQKIAATTLALATTLWELVRRRRRLVVASSKDADRHFVAIILSITSLEQHGLIENIGSCLSSCQGGWIIDGHLEAWLAIFQHAFHHHHDLVKLEEDAQPLLDDCSLQLTKALHSLVSERRHQTHLNAIRKPHPLHHLHSVE